MCLTLTTVGVGGGVSVVTELCLLQLEAGGRSVPYTHNWPQAAPTNELCFVRSIFWSAEHHGHGTSSNIFIDYSNVQKIPLNQS